MKYLIYAVLIGFIFFSESAEAYDLPKISHDEEITENQTDTSSRWECYIHFEQELKLLLAENENLPASSPARINKDKNLVFIAFYKGNAYFLDRYSIKISKNQPDKQVWQQHIFPIGNGISQKNSKYTQQKFCFQDNEFYNSLRQNKKISQIENDEDKKFLKECLKVGYYYAFKKEIDVK